MGVHFRDVNLPFQDRAQLCSPSYSSPSPWLCQCSANRAVSAHRGFKPNVLGSMASRKPCNSPKLFLSSQCSGVCVCDCHLKLYNVL